MVITKQQMEQQAENKTAEEAELVTVEDSTRRVLVETAAGLVSTASELMNRAEQLIALAREL